MAQDWENSQGERHHHRTDPSEGGWDTSIVRAPDSHKRGSKRRRRKRRHRSTAVRVLQAIGIVLAVLVGLAAAVALGLLIALRITGTI